MKKIKVAFVHWESPNDHRASSGTPYKINEMLKGMGYDTIWVKNGKGRCFFLYGKFIGLLNRLFPTHRISAYHTAIGARLQAMTFGKKVIDACDLVFAPMASSVLSSLKMNTPIIYLSDATFASMIGYYFLNLSSWAIKQGNQVEQRAMDNASSIIVSSDWARNSAIKDYHQSPAKVHMVEFGANLDDKDIIEKHYSYDGTLHLLFLGVDWQRKGGDLAVAACKYLNEHGTPAILHVVGIKNLSPSIKELPFVDDAGFLNKNHPAEYEKLVSIIKQCHCMLLPTLAECAGIAFCESSAYGLPVFTHDTGGTSNYVLSGRNGYLLPIGSTGKDFAKKIQGCLQSGELAKMSTSAKEVYHERLNWETWQERVKHIIEDLLAQSKK